MFPKAPRRFNISSKKMRCQTKRNDSGIGPLNLLDVSVYTASVTKTSIFKLFACNNRYVQRHGRQFNKNWAASPHQNQTRNRNQIRYRKNSLYRREMKLLRTMICAVLAFLVCWTPYLICALLDDHIIPDEVKNVSRTNN